jgi:ankyrin repeat protein
LGNLSKKAKVLLFSRELNEISVKLTKAMESQPFDTLSISKSDTESDINRFIEREIRILGLPSMDIEQTVIKTLQAGAQGMFQWVDQMIKNLAEPGKVFAEEYLDALRDLPQSLDELYGRILASVPNRGVLRSRSKLLLQWLACAIRPLSLSEIAAVLELSIDQQRTPKRTIVDLSQLKQVIHHCCGTLVRYVDTDEKGTLVTLVHASVKEFLLASARPASSYSDLLVNQQVTDRSCLTYLCYGDIGFAPFEVEVDTLGNIKDTMVTMSEKFSRFINQFPLLEYAALNWYKHHLRSKSPPKSLPPAYERTLNRFCSSPKSTIKWLQLYLRLRGDQLIFGTSQAIGDIDLLVSLEDDLSQPSKFRDWLAHLKGPDHGRFIRWQRFMNSGYACDFLSELHVAAFFDFDEFLRESILHGADVNQISVTRQTPLILAARGDSVVSTKLLLQSGADVNALGWSANTALSWGIDSENWRKRERSGPFNVVPLLLEADADPNLVYGRLPPLYRACRIQYPDDPFLLTVVTLLLENGATKCIDGHPQEESPLFWAVMNRAPKLTSLLLRNGANVDGGVSKDLRRSPLLSLLSMPQPNFEIVKVLLDGGANVNVATVDGRTPLHFSAHCSSEVANLLLKRGARVNEEANDGSLPIHDAVRENNIPLIMALVSSGTDIDKEDGAGKSPLAIAVESGYQEASKLLVDAGASKEGSSWQILWHGDEMKVLHKERLYYPQNAQEIDEAYIALYFLLRRLSKFRPPRGIVLSILESARYWLKSTASRFERVIVDQDLAKLEVPYILSDPVQGRANAPIREIKFVIRSHDQGWSDYPQHHGTYIESMTWFDVYIQKAGQQRVDWGTLDRCLVRNIHASSTPKEHWIICSRGDFSQRNCKWLDWIQPGDRVGILPKAIYGGWINHVESASIEILCTHLPEH